jgi:amidase
VIRDDLQCLVPTSVGLPATGTGALDGRTFVAKDLFAVAGHTSSFGSARWRDTHDPSPSTAPAVARLLAAGADLVGMGKMDSLAYSLIGNAGEGAAPRNPMHPERFTGGSTSGPAAAVAGGLADLGLGSDTGGSIRVPAAACELWSIRTTHGRIDVGGTVPLAPSFDTVGLLARDPTVLRDADRALATDDGAAVGAVGAPTEVLVAADTFAWIDPDAANAIARAADAIASACGCSWESTDLRGFTSVETAQLFARVQGREVWAQHGDWVTANRDALLPEVRGRLERCRGWAADADDDVAADASAANRLRRAFGELVGPGTCLVLPVLPDLLPRRDATDDELLAFRAACVRLTALASLAGAPEVVVPVLHQPTGRTFGVGLVGAAGADRSLLDVAVRLGAHGVVRV